ncbi:Sporulation-control protein spo0M [Peribacillus sp. Bi96]|uniref:sporulation protein n=1 Tax=unclassified Peribacillus TaxID=2675266 RepID=UPI001DDF6D9A|nr:sporulation protein [Peribacillus sp. Bi96]CAH0313435.1 Sporulation-control protein spo0M [Peribacillus sp. Bi96]
MFKKILASLGKGAATVDLQCDNRNYQAGENIQGEVIIQGGEVEQKINQLTVRLMMNVVLKQGSVSKEVAHIPLVNRDRILSKERKVIPFHYVLPTNIPISRGTVSYYLDTHLDIEGGFDRKDVDRLVIQSQESIQSIFNAMSQLGFRETADSGKLDQYGQEFAFFPTQQYLGQVNEVEMRFANEESGIRVWMEVDCKSGYKEIEAKREFHLNQNVLEHEAELEKLLGKYISEAIEQPYAFSQPFSYSTNHQQVHTSQMGNAIPGMIGGLAVGVLGTMLLTEMMEGFDVEEMFEEATEDFDGGFDAFFDNGDGES